MNPLPAARESRVVTYRRVSSAEQRNGRGDREAFGLDAQGAALRAFVEREGLEVAADFTEDVSGTLPLDQRPELQAALSTALRLGAGAVVVARRDRLARDEWAAYDALRTMRAAGLRVLYADGSNADDESALLLDGISHVIAAHERRVIVARLRAGRAAKAARHPGAQAHGGKVPYGYRRMKGQQP